MSRHLLKKLVSKHKVNNLTNNFIKKVRRNSIYRTPVEDYGSEGMNEYKTTCINKIEKSLQVIG